MRIDTNFEGDDRYNASGRRINFEIKQDLTYEIPVHRKFIGVERDRGKFEIARDRL